MTQVLTGHGCFGECLGRIRRDESAKCHHCDHLRDDAQHTLANCPAWVGERADLVAAVGANLSLPAVVAAIVGNKEKWSVFSSFCEGVLLQKEEAKRERERAGRNTRRHAPSPESREERDDPSWLSGRSRRGGGRGGSFPLFQTILERDEIAGGTRDA